MLVGENVHMEKPEGRSFIAPFGLFHTEHKTLAFLIAVIFSEDSG